MLIWVLSAALALQADGLPKGMSLSDPQEAKEEHAQAERQTQPFVDFDWLDLTTGIGVATYSSEYRAPTSFSASIRAHVPMPWLSPRSNPGGEYFGLFAEAAFSTIDRDLDSSVDHRRGVASFFSFGADYTFLRGGSWILMARAGALYAYYGGVADLQDGFGPLVGATVGYHLSKSSSITYSPELTFGRGGDSVFFNHLGILIEF